MISVGDYVYDDEWGVLLVSDIEPHGWLEVFRRGRGFPCKLHKDLATRLSTLDLYLLIGDT